MPCGGKTATLRGNRLLTWSPAWRIVAVEAITFGRTTRPSTSQEASRSTAVSYSPTSVPSGPLIRCSSSWMIRSGGRSGPHARVSALGKSVPGRVAAAVFHVRRAEAVAAADTGHLPEEQRVAPFHGIWANLSTVAMSSAGSSR